MLSYFLYGPENNKERSTYGAN